jgi:maltose O-acetyltransferase
MNIIGRVVRKYILGIKDQPMIEQLKKQGLVIGENCSIMGECILDPSHCWFIKIGNNVTLAPRVHILAHDASTKRKIGFTKIGLVEIGDDVFVGANSTILPNVRIGSNSIIGANSLVSKSVPENCVYAGNPARFICTIEDYYNKVNSFMYERPKYNNSYTINGGITEEMKERMRLELQNGIGFVE